MSDETVTFTAGQEEEEGEAGAARRRQRRLEPVLALVLAFCAEEPHRVGECAFFTEGVATLIGRGAARSDDGAPRALLARIRPGQSEVAPPLRSRWISRQQLRVVRRGEWLEIGCVGRVPMKINGQPAEQGRLWAGDMVEVGEHLLLLCAWVPEELPAIPGLALHPFGEPDALGMVGESAASWQLRRVVAAVAPRRSHVLIQGESGTGKELVARALHHPSAPGGVLIARSAATLPEGLVDAELFGNAENYPQSGMAARPGLIGAAHQGTLFLDEIAELPEAMQARLLRVLDQGEYHRLGESQARRADFRLIAATNRPDSALKPDVLARFPVRIHLPPLAERRTDIPLLARHLLRHIAAEDPAATARFFDDGHNPRLSTDLLRRLLQHDHPDNVRGLLSILWGAILHSPDHTLLPPPAQASPARQNDVDWRAFVGAPPAEIPPEALQACLDDHNGSQEQAWQALNLASRHILGRLIRKHALTLTVRRER